MIAEGDQQLIHLAVSTEKEFSIFRFERPETGIWVPEIHGLRHIAGTWNCLRKLSRSCSEWRIASSGRTSSSSMPFELGRKRARGKSNICVAAKAMFSSRSSRANQVLSVF